MDTPNIASFIRARDPSIITSHMVFGTHAQMKLEGQFTADIDEDEHNMQVFLRIKNVDFPRHLYSIENEKHLHCSIPETSQAGRNIRPGKSVKKKYTFKKVFQPLVTQRDIFDNVVKPQLLKFINAQTSTLITCGASGSGKTFTILGTANDPGIIPRALEYVFKSLSNVSNVGSMKPHPSGKIELLDSNKIYTEKQKVSSFINECVTQDQDHLHTFRLMQQRLSGETVASMDENNVNVEIWISFIQIYNENITDLLVPYNCHGQKLKLGTSGSYSYVKDLNVLNVSNSMEAYVLLQYGIQNLIYARTNINDQSSRSHSVFTIWLVQSNNNKYQLSHINFYDLAGFERSKRTHNTGVRQQESKSINTSWLVLGRCISIIQNPVKRHCEQIPFRDSKLTRLLQSALLGQETIAMIVTINPTEEAFDESQHVLELSAQAKKIQIEHVPIQLHTNEFQRRYDNNLQTVQENDLEQEAHIETLQNQIALLEMELDGQRTETAIIEKDTRRLLNTEYMNLFDDLQSKWKSRLDQEIRTLNKHHQAHIELITESYESRLEQMRNEDPSVIVLDDSDENVNEIKNENNELAQFKHESISLKATINELKLELQNKDIELLTKNQRISNLESLLKVGRTSCKLMESKLNKMNTDNEQLEAENYKLKEELEVAETLNNSLYKTFNSSESLNDEYIETS